MIILVIIFFVLLKHNGSENVLSTYIPIIKPSIKTFQITLQEEQK